MNQDDIQNLINQARTCTITCNVELHPEQMDALQNLNEYCVNLVLQTPEVVREPLKIVYKSNEEFKFALIAFCLCQSLTNPRRKVKESKEFFENDGQRRVENRILAEYQSRQPTLSKQLKFLLSAPSLPHQLPIPPVLFLLEETAIVRANQIFRTIAPSCCCCKEQCLHLVDTNHSF